MLEQRRVGAGGHPCWCTQRVPRGNSHGSPEEKHPLRGREGNPPLLSALRSGMGTTKEKRLPDAGGRGNAFQPFAMEISEDPG